MVQERTRTRADWHNVSTTALLERFSERLDAYERWRLKLLKALESYQGWFVQQEDKTSSDELRMFELLELVRADKLTIALVGEFSRGKTELINAIFFGDYKRRLLPSTPGRTTMCPTEITYDPKLEPCIRLLPVETRKSAVTISELKRTTVNWTTLPLNLDSPDEMAETLQEIVRTKTVTVRQARALGFLSYGDMTRGLELKDGGIEIPVRVLASAEAGSFVMGSFDHGDSDPRELPDQPADQSRLSRSAEPYDSDDVFHDRS